MARSSKSGNNMFEAQGSLSLDNLYQNKLRIVLPDGTALNVVDMKTRDVLALSRRIAAGGALRSQAQSSLVTTKIIGSLLENPADVTRLLEIPSPFLGRILQWLYSPLEVEYEIPEPAIIGSLQRKESEEPLVVRIPTVAEGIAALNDAYIYQETESPAIYPSELSKREQAEAVADLRHLMAEALKELPALRSGALPLDDWTEFGFLDPDVEARFFRHRDQNLPVNLLEYAIVASALPDLTFTDLIDLPMVQLRALVSFVDDQLTAYNAYLTEQESERNRPTRRRTKSR